ncbi:MAG: ATP-binding cassette domain-containing protein [Ardenticatenaceae bacterium]|nr:ATP-binding cassette domain-containing protein [Ardenticatenaceae bacterium]
MSRPVLEIKGICKAFPGVVANHNATLSVLKGEVHAIVGENGAGKTTLMNILYGLQQPDAGTIRVRGETVQISSPRVAKRLGIGMVHQHFMLVPSFTVAQNVVLGYEPTRKGVIVDRRHAEAAVGALCERYNLSLPLSEPVANLPVGVQQRVEIIKAIYRGADVLILDEPTAVLTPLEVRELFRICREMANRGKTILFISHKLREVLALSDRVTVMREGRTVATLTTHGTDEHELARLIVGRDRIWAIRKDRMDGNGPVALQVKALEVRGPQHTLAVTLRTGYKPGGFSGNA